MGYWKSFAVVGSATLAVLGLIYAICWQLPIHPVTTGIILAVALIVLFVSMMAAVWA